ncbi:class I SAM-dependent methyltransferase [Solirubrobacter sp. CPCC 204708]|uniref:Class I SAM-dependent methyltransferase n=1 Tax=Solirubrobacter deserti TaxID=2282478 RepID=A0ABT4RPJ0_9ACTN|nr:class I SAM-dependent methyltransferase [Solirubrobacter deserti]MBE2319947.1 class I SAM-dependent methyltransferase [Solirubrobacter deserti]MDA0140459.1 class I SAM-dependent methyltransferase [Solirubrobacter deserti]
MTAQGTLWGARALAWGRTEDQQLETYREALRRVPLAAGASVLDVGCGTGAFLRLAHDRGARVSGLDASPELLALARERVPAADLRVGDMEALPYDDDAFDAVFGFNAFFFARDMTAALREARRVARSGAPVVIQVWGNPEWCDLTRMKDAVFALAPGGDSPPPPPLWSPGVLEQIASAAGLTPGDAFDLEYAFHYAGEAELVELLLAPAPVGAAVRAAGEDAVRDAILTSLQPLRRPDGSFRLRNQWRYLVAYA